MARRKKLLIPTICILAFWFVAISHSLADEIAFKLSASDSNLKVMTASGDLIATIPVSTIGQTVETPQTSFQISFGCDERGNLSAIVSADPKHPSGLGFEILGRRIDTNKDSIVIATFSKDLKQITIEPGCLGGVKVDGKILARPATLINTAPTVASTTSSKTEPTTPFSPSVTIIQSDITVYDSSPESSTIALASEFKSRNPTVLLVPLDPAKPLTQQQISEMVSANQIALKKLFWAEPVTPPEGVQAVTIAVASTEVKLAEIKGDVTIVPAAQGVASTAKNGVELAPTSKLVTGDNSSVAVMIGGINSIRLTSGTTAMVSLSTDNMTHKKTTLIDLKEGTVFCKVGFRELDMQDFKVKTQNGLVVTHGTDFSASFNAGRSTIMCVQGTVEVMDSGGNYLGTTAPRVEHSVGCLAFGRKTPPAQLLHDLLSTLALASQFNAKINGILDRQAAGQTCTPLELEYLKRVAMVDLAIKPSAENAPLLLTRQMPPPSVIETVAPSFDSQSASNTKPESDSPDSSLSAPTLVTSVIKGNSQNPALNNPDPPLATPY